MPSENDAERQAALDAWRAILDNAVLARQWAAALSREDFAKDRQVFYAVTRCLEIVSEAARRLRGPEQTRFPSIPWRQIEDAGNVYRHRYQVVAESQIWLTATRDLKELEAAAIIALGATPPRIHTPT